MAKNETAHAERLSTRSLVLLALIPPAIVLLGGIAIGLAWGTENGFGRALRAMFVSSAGPIAFLFRADLFVRILVAIGILVIYVGLAKVTPLGRAKPHKIFLGSLVWCAIGLVGFVVMSAS